MPIPSPTERLRFGEMSASDLDFMATLLGDEQVMAFYPRPKSRAEARSWIEWNRSLYRTHGFGLWLLELRDGAVPVGDCGLTPQVIDGVEELEVGYHVHPSVQGQGLATEAATAVRDYARILLGRPRVVAIVDPRNEPSKRVARHIGLSVEKTATWKGRRVQVLSSDA